MVRAKCLIILLKIYINKKKECGKQLSVFSILFFLGGGQILIDDVL